MFNFLTSYVEISVDQGGQQHDLSLFKNADHLTLNPAPSSHKLS
jgi:hypothetical protein